MDFTKAPQTPISPDYGDISEVWKNGRPYKYSNLYEVETRVENFFAECEATGKRPNVSDLALALGTYYKRLLIWENPNIKDDDSEAIRAFKTGLRDIISRAKTRCASAWWSTLEDRDKARGGEFALKVMGYQDRPAESPHNSVQVTQNILVSSDSPALADLFGGLLPKPVQQAIAKPANNA